MKGRHRTDSPPRIGVRRLFALRVWLHGNDRRPRSRTVSSLGPPASKLTWDFGTLGGNLNISNQFFSSAIAPGANFANTAPINGSIFVDSYLNGQGEIHDKDGGYVVQHNGFNPLAVPEPSTLVFSALGAIGGGLLAARRGRIR